ncbi:FKBP-type peptidyl-prolyl cis-trans isomerase [Flavobacterium ardleyense]|uniref:FKBP-type peptidyl-prolyl cis-trans isomerase n=1 Tax=Flavobacterium ardleyense TaxID=2038737 RepID=A0ABW5Z661_9FLAO
MKSVFKIALLVVGITTLFSCNKSDDVSITPPRPYSEVYEEDKIKIKDFLDTHYVTVDADFNTTFTQIPAGGTQQSIFEMPELEFKDVEANDITYRLYYLKLREGSGVNPTRVDSAFVSYKGNTFMKTTAAGVDTYTQNVFEFAQSPEWETLDGVIRGWGEIIPEFKTGTYTSNSDGTISFDDYGAGVMFIPSGLGYFNLPRPSIPVYAPLIFNFKLYNQRYRDHDGDGILSKDEYGDFNGIATDTDGDGIPDYLDPDDDGDGYLTKFEIRKPLPLLTGQGTSLIYPFNPIVDDPLTTGVDESEPKGIPDASGDGTTPTRLRRHLDRNAKPPYNNY